MKMTGKLLSVAGCSIPISERPLTLTTGYRLDTSEYGADGLSNTRIAVRFKSAVDTRAIASKYGLIRAKRPDWNQKQVLQVKKSIVDLGPSGFDKQFGFGRLDALKAVTP